MSEIIQFWLDNKMSAGIKLTTIGNLALVVYREKYYVVENDAAQTRSGKSLHYSKSSLPLMWKKALKGDSSLEGQMLPSNDLLPIPTLTKRERKKKECLPSLSASQTTSELPLAQTHSAITASRPKITRNINKKPTVQTSVSFNCPECNFKHEFPPEKAKNEKPFLMTCIRCKADFAVRFISTTIYHSQVAGFR